MVPRGPFPRSAVGARTDKSKKPSRGHTRAKRVVPREGLEPPRLSATDFESAASTIPPPGPLVFRQGLSQGLLTRRRVALLAFWPPFVHPFAAPFSLSGNPLTLAA